MNADSSLHYDVQAMRDRLDVTVHFEDGALWATVDRFPGVFATGRTLDELRESLCEGIALVLAAPGEQPPQVELAGFAAQPAVASASAALVCA